jgi:hypothetical protein
MGMIGIWLLIRLLLLQGSRDRGQGVVVADVSYLGRALN